MLISLSCLGDLSMRPPLPLSCLVDFFGLVLKMEIGHCRYSVKNNSKCLKSSVVFFCFFLSLDNWNSHSFAAPSEARVQPCEKQQAGCNKIHDTAINIGEFKIQSLLGSGSHPFGPSIFQPPGCQRGIIALQKRFQISPLKPNHHAVSI